MQSYTALAETHLKRPIIAHDPHPGSSFSPLPPLIPTKLRKEQAIAGQRAELDHILASDYKSVTSASMLDDDTSSMSGGRRSRPGGLGADRLTRESLNGLRQSTSVGNFKQKRPGGLGGVFVDSSGKIHDTEFDPFAGAAEMSRRKTRRRSAFAADRTKGSDTASSSSSDDVKVGGERMSAGGQSQFDAKERMEEEREKEQREIRRQLESERRRLDDVSGYAAARRKSMMSERSGRGSPSIRSSEDGALASANGHGLGSARSVNLDRGRSQQGYYVPSPLSPTFGEPARQSSSMLETTEEGCDGEGDEAAALPRERRDRRRGSRAEESRTGPGAKQKGKSREMTIEYSGGKTIHRGFDAPITPIPETPTSSSQLQPGRRESGRISPRPQPPQRPREQLFPETPAQSKKREERERHAARAGLGISSRHPTPQHLAVDTRLPSRGRALPEIEIVEDDDPRIIFPSNGPTTNIQTVHDHVIRGPFAHALYATGPGSMGVGTGERPSSARSLQYTAGDGRAASTIIDDSGGYLPSRWASGDRALRKDEAAKEKYRPREWGGSHGDLAGKPDGWQ
jgi:hypothetical protein